MQFLIYLFLVFFLLFINLLVRFFTDFNEFIYTFSNNNMCKELNLNVLLFNVNTYMIGWLGG